MHTGDYSLPVGVRAHLKLRGYDVFVVDNSDCSISDGVNIRDNAFFVSLTTRANLGEFLAIFALPPRSGLGSANRDDGRSRALPDGVPNGPVIKVLDDTNLVVQRITQLIHMAARAGTQYIICGPADHGDKSDPRLFISADHVPLWLLHPVKQLASDTGGHTSTFAMCAYGGSRQDYTVLLYSPGLAAQLGPLDRGYCSHPHHGKTPPLASSPPMTPAFSVVVGDALASLCAPTLASALPIDPLAVEEALPQASAPTNPIVAPQDYADTRAPPADEDSVLLVTAETNLPVGLRRQDVQRERKKPPAFAAFARVAGDTAADPLRIRNHGIGHALLARTRCAHALLAKRLGTDPKNHKAAMLDDKEGWLHAERNELANHEANASFTKMSRRDLPAHARHRKLTNLTWVYKTKRDGKRKARRSASKDALKSPVATTT